MKTCGMCRETKPECQFSKNKTKADGLQNRCKSCASLHRVANREKIKFQNREYRAKNPEKSASWSKKWKKNNWNMKVSWKSKGKDKLGYLNG